MKTIYFTSERNYLKHDPSSGNAVMNGPNTSAYGGFIFTSNLIVQHDLGFVPMFKTLYEPFGDGVVWEPLANRTAQEVFNPLTGSPGPGLIAWADSTNLTLQLFFPDASLAAIKFPVYFTIYLDFAL